jgi:hypothetical protein
LVISILVSSLTSFGQECIVKTFDKSNIDYYTEMTFLSEGEINWSEDKSGNEVGIAFRLVIVTSEIYDAIYLEKSSVGSEGGGKKILWKRMFNNEDLIQTFKLTGEFAGAQFIKWLSWNSFELQIQNKKLLFKNIDSDQIIVLKKT